MKFHLFYFFIYLKKHKKTRLSAQKIRLQKRKTPTFHDLKNKIFLQTTNNQ